MYYVSGYAPPAGVTNKDQVKELQRQLGVKADGVWGPKTQAAYGSMNSSAVPQGYSALVKELQSMFQPTPISYGGASRAELEAGLRPSYDIAMRNRQAQTATNKANIDADAAARGMGTSTWVTDVKNRQQNAEASDVAMLEADYARQLQDMLSRENANRFAADQFNAASQASSLQAALGVAGGLYAQQLASSKKSSGSGRSAEAPIEDFSSLASLLGSKYGGNYGGALDDVYKNQAVYRQKYGNAQVTDAISGLIGR